MGAVGVPGVEDAWVAAALGARQRGSLGTADAPDDGSYEIYTF